MSNKRLITISVSKENQEVLIIYDALQNTQYFRANISDILCKFIIQGYRTDALPILEQAYRMTKKPKKIEENKDDQIQEAKTN